MTGERLIPYIDLRRSFHIRPLRRVVNPIELDEPPHRHNFQEMLWIKNGRGQHRIDHTNLQIEPQTFYLISQGQIHYFTEGVDLEGYLIRFTDDFLINSQTEDEWHYRITLFGHFAIHRSLTVPDEALPFIEQLLSQIVAEHSKAQFGQLAVLRHFLNVLLIQLERIRRDHTSPEMPLSADGSLYQQFLETLESRYHNNHQVADYAAALHLTPRQLSRIVRQFTGKTAKQLIQDRILLEAKRYLQHTNGSVKEIAYALGFSDPSYFSKVFKQALGVSPHHYKAELPELIGR